MQLPKRTLAVSSIAALAFAAAPIGAQAATHHRVAAKHSKGVHLKTASGLMIKKVRGGAYGYDDSGIEKSSSLDRSSGLYDN